MSSQGPPPQNDPHGPYVSGYPAAPPPDPRQPPYQPPPQYQGQAPPGQQPAHPQPPPQQPGYHGQNMPPQGGFGRVVIESSFFPLAWILYLTGVRVTIDGRTADANWGTLPVDLPVGQHQIAIRTRYIWDYGPAQAVVPVGPGQQVPVYYRAPILPYGMAGAIGPTPQKTPWVAVYWVLIGVVFLIVILVVLAAVL
jgi:hypothetical protein